MTSLAFLNSRWVATVASAYLESNAGLQYVFGDISGALRSKLRYTQRQIDGLGTAKARHARATPPLAAQLSGGRSAAQCSAASRTCAAAAVRARAHHPPTPGA